MDSRPLNMDYIMYQKSNALYLAPAYFVDSDNADIQSFAKEIVGDSIDPIA